MLDNKTEQYSFDVIVIGAGPGGYVAAIRAAQLGMKTAIIEANHLGGICLNWGCIPTKALLKSAEMFQKMSHAQDYGLSVKDIAFDLDKIVQRSRDVSAKLSGGISHLMKKNNVSVFNGYGKLIGMNAQSKLQQVSVSNNDKVEAQLSAKHIILATGARAKSFPGLEDDGERVWSYKEALVPKKMPKSLLVIGSGAIGIEFANFYQTFGCDVTVVEAMDQIMPFEDKEIADIAQGAMKKRGMKFKLATKVVELERLKDQVTATIEKNGKTEQLTIEQVITAVGVIPNIENIGLSTAEVSLDQQGFIAVDDFCQTSAQGIYAIGDVAGAPCLAHKASHEAIICIEKIAEQKTVHALDKSMIPACTYGFPQVASIGLTEKKAKDQGFKVRTGKFPFQANGKAIAQGDTDGLVKVIFDDVTGELLGAHMVGNDVTELIQGFTIAKTMETTEDELMHTVFPHPTLSEMMHESVLDAFQRAIHI
ncbi:dihydrolipoyl dehydrogenase [Colwellia sp. KU-HH00111]|uniref:dihydrolipoyl dehydrogenase n=1 Tax=Colwellia sp. KU-HH00111 TaxID=3127652 RepID=UPI0031023E97